MDNPFVLITKTGGFLQEIAQGALCSCNSKVSFRKDTEKRSQSQAGCCTHCPALKNASITLLFGFQFVRKCVKRVMLMGFFFFFLKLVHACNVICFIVFLK